MVKSRSYRKGGLFRIFWISFCFMWTRVKECQVCFCVFVYLKMCRKLFEKNRMAEYLMFNHNCFGMQFRILALQPCTRCGFSFSQITHISLTCTQCSGDLTIFNAIQTGKNVSFTNSQQCRHCRIWYILNTWNMHSIFGFRVFCVSMQTYVLRIVSFKDILFSTFSFYFQLTYLYLLHFNSIVCSTLTTHFHPQQILYYQLPPLNVER